MGDLFNKNFLISFLLCILIMMAWSKWLMPPLPTQETTTQNTAFEKTETAQPTTQIVVPTYNTPTTVVQTGWHFLNVPSTDDAILGSIDQTTGFKAEVIISSKTGSIRACTLSEHKLICEDESIRYPLLKEITFKNGTTLDSFRLSKMVINGRTELFDLSDDIWRIDPIQTNNNNASQTIVCTATLVDSNNAPILNIQKKYTYKKENYELDFELTLFNQTQNPISVASIDMQGPVGFIKADTRMDQRSVTVGFVKSENRISAEQERNSTSPTDDSVLLEKPDDTHLSWIGGTNKFFAAVLRPLPQTNQKYVDFIADEKVHAVIKAQDPDDASQNILSSQFKLNTSMPIAVSGINNYKFKIYLGAIDPRIFADEKYGLQFFDYHNLEPAVGCNFCAFEWLTTGLMTMLDILYSIFFHNYGIAIIILVILVRIVLHPLTKKGQISMMGMQKIAPQMEELKNKYGDDQKLMQKKTMELYREAGFNPVMGCLPMLLQMPIWIGLYTAVGSYIAIRHEGLFPTGFFPGGFNWINDLSAPDRLIPFSALGITPFELPLLGTIDAFNLLPFLLAIGMYLQQKLMTPATTTTMSSQMEQQQKMMKIMMPIMMLLFLYIAPSGINLYIMASTFGGVIEQKVIRKHIKKQEELEKKQPVVVDRPKRKKK